MESLVSEYDKGGYIRERTGPTVSAPSPSNVYPTSDGNETPIAGNQYTVFRRLADAMGRPELATDERYATRTPREALTRPSSTTSSPTGPVRSRPTRSRRS